MALDRSNRYPGRFLNPTAEQPQGAFKNRTSPTAEDGSYFEADWANDMGGFLVPFSPTQACLPMAPWTQRRVVRYTMRSKHYSHSPPGSPAR